MRHEELGSTEVFKTVGKDECSLVMLLHYSLHFYLGSVLFGSRAGGCSDFFVFVAKLGVIVFWSQSWHY